MKFTKKFYCPANGWDCPYCNKDLSCALVDKGCDPVAECDDAAMFWEPNEDYFVWEDENGVSYDAIDLLKEGFHFINGEPALSPSDNEIKMMKAVADVLTSPCVGIVEIKTRNPNWRE